MKLSISEVRSREAFASRLPELESIIAAESNPESGAFVPPVLTADEFKQRFVPEDAQEEDGCDNNCDKAEEEQEVAEVPAKKARIAADENPDAGAGPSVKKESSPRNISVLWESNFISVASKLKGISYAKVRLILISWASLRNVR